MSASSRRRPPGRRRTRTAGPSRGRYSHAPPKQPTRCGPPRCAHCYAQQASHRQRQVRSSAGGLRDALLLPPAHGSGYRIEKSMRCRLHAAVSWEAHLAPAWNEPRESAPPVGARPLRRRLRQSALACPALSWLVRLYSALTAGWWPVAALRYVVGARLAAVGWARQVPRLGVRLPFDEVCPFGPLAALARGCRPCSMLRTSLARPTTWLPAIVTAALLAGAAPAAANVPLTRVSADPFTNADRASTRRRSSPTPSPSEHRRRAPSRSAASSTAAPPTSASPAPPTAARPGTRRASCRA